ncbi:MAG: amino acid ABC transporter ATP-binding protein, partial [Spirochaetales bacterium]|nr:amino acid ABC transporter ATP-binding protein [Spirochaetales bacterium]
MTVIEAHNIHKSFGPLEVLKGINLTINQGEVVSILGPSGSGKSTFLRSLINLETIDNGSITICGYPVIVDGEYEKNEFTKKAYRKLGLVFQNFNLFPHKSVLQNIVMSQMIVRKISRSEATDKALRLLSKVNLSDKKNAYPCQLSGGQQQRV